MSDTLFARFRDLVAGRCAFEILAVDRALDEGLRAGRPDADLDGLRARRATLKALPDSLVDGPPADLAAQWPKDFPPLPLWVRDPAAAALKDRPGDPVVVDCRLPDPPPPPEPVPVDELDLDSLRALRLAFAEADRDRASADLDAAAPEFRSPRAKLSLQAMRDQVAADFAARAAAIARATTRDVLKDL